MTSDDVHKHFKNNWSDAMRKLGFSQNAYQNWLKIGYIPVATQIRIEEATNYKLKSDLTKQRK
jgi:hypothetical protein